MLELRNLLLLRYDFNRLMDFSTSLPKCRAHKIDKPEKGCILLNHWSQRAILLTDYDVGRGAKGYEIRSQSGAVDFLNWPPLS